MQQLRELVAQLQADNERLLREKGASVAGPSLPNFVVNEPNSVVNEPSAVASPFTTERLVVVPRNRKCPMFNGKSGIGIIEWIEEVQACMRARHLLAIDQAYFIFDHLEGEARREIKYQSSIERSDPTKIFDILKELYGCASSYVTLQQAFFSRQQQEGETLLEFSLALMALMEQVEQQAPAGTLDVGILLRDQFVEHVLDVSLRRELKQFIRRQPGATLLDMRGEAMRWEREGLPGGFRGCSFSLPSAYGVQYGVQGSSPLSSAITPRSEFGELRELLNRQQGQIDQLTQALTSLQQSSRPNRPSVSARVICHRCQRPGHLARECEGERVGSRTSVPSGASFNRARPSSAAHPEN